jgi:hypothetical protein
MVELDDRLAKFRKSAATVRTAATSVYDIRLRPYRAFAEQESRAAYLLLKGGLIKKAQSDFGLPYGYLTKFISDGYGFCFSLTYALPAPSGPMVIEIRGEGLTPLLESILRGTAREVQIFDPHRFEAPPEGTFDKTEDAWQGVPVVREILVTDKNSEVQPDTRH